MGAQAVWLTYSCHRPGALPVTASVSTVRPWAELPVSGVFRDGVPEKTCGDLQTVMRQERPDKEHPLAEATVGWRAISESMKC